MLINRKKRITVAVASLHIMISGTVISKGTEKRKRKGKEKRNAKEKTKEKRARKRGWEHTLFRTKPEA